MHSITEGQRTFYPGLQVGDAVRMRPPGQRKWTLGHCTRPLGLRSYEVEIDGRRFRRNRRQLRSTPELPSAPRTEIEESTTQTRGQTIPPPVWDSQPHCHVDFPLRPVRLNKLVYISIFSASLRFSD